MISDLLSTTTEWEVRLGSDVRRLRVARELTQAQLAERANVSVSAVQDLERGRGSSLTTVIRVARALDRADWLAAFAPAAPTVSPAQLWRSSHGEAARSRQRVRRPKGPA
ncbi:MAG: helix-turn-helix transcriptional regulator [Acidimicrobiales bacterium]